MKPNLSTDSAPKLQYDLGLFIGTKTDFSYHRHLFSADEVIQWGRQPREELSFRAAGDRDEMLWFGPNLTGSDLAILDDLLFQLGGDTTENFLKIYRALDHENLAFHMVDVENARLAGGQFYQSFLSVEHALWTAAREVFKAKFPEASKALSYCLEFLPDDPPGILKDRFPAAYAEWMAHCDERQDLDPRRFLKAQKFCVETFSLPDCAAVFLIPE